MIEKNDIKEFDFIIGEVKKEVDESQMSYYIDAEDLIEKNLVKEQNRQIKELKEENEKLEIELERYKANYEYLRANFGDALVTIEEYKDAYGELELIAYED